MSKGSYNDFFEALAQKESGGKYDKINKKFHYLGKYQLGEEALIDAGYYKKDGCQTDNKFKDNFWTGRDGVHSKEDFLNNPQAQENAVRAFAERNWGYIKSCNLDLYAGQVVLGYLMTISGMLAAAHLLGVFDKNKGLEVFIKKGIVGKDGFGTPITEYIEKFGGYDTPFEPRKKLTALKKDKQTKTTEYQVDYKAWISKATAIEMIKNKELDGVIVTTKNGSIYLRTRPDKKLENNLE